MTTQHLIALPSQELSTLLCATTAPQFAQLFDQLPFFRAALQAPVDDRLIALATSVLAAIGEVRNNTNYPEDWDDDCVMAEQLLTQKRTQMTVQADAPARPAPKLHGNTVCTCCMSHRIARVYSKACNCNWFSIPHLGFKAEGYMPSNMGIPGDSDGPSIELCLDCGRVVNGVYPLPADVLKQRVDAYIEDCRS